MVVIPERPRSLVVLVLERCCAGLPGHVELIPEFHHEEIVPGALCGEAARNVVCRGQEPSFGKAITLLCVMPAVQMGHDWNRTGIRPRCACEGRVHISTSGAPWWVRPVERRVDRQEVRNLASSGCHLSQHQAKGLECAADLVG